VFPLSSDPVKVVWPPEAVYLNLADVPLTEEPADCHPLDP